MDFKSFLETLPQIFTLFVPGFVFIKTFCYFMNAKSNSFENTAVVSVTISYVINLVVDLLAKLITISDLLLKLLAIILAVICALTIVKLKTSGVLKKSMKWIGKISDSDNIWQDIFDRNKGSRIRCFSKYNKQDVIIEGDVKYYEICEDGECSIALINYIVTYEDKTKYKLGKRDDEPIMYINTRNIHGLEVTYGK